MASNHNILCTICARGGSKGIKNKNIRKLLGKPVIAYTVLQALKWTKASHIVVSTDSEKIAKVAKRFGAEVFFIRPKELARDNSPKLLSIKHALKKSERFYSQRFDIIVDLDVTSPLRKIKDLDNCLKIFLKRKPQTLFSVVKAQRNPYFNMVEIKKDGFARLSKNLATGVTCRQDAPSVYDMNASIYFYSRDFLLKGRCLTPVSRRTAIYLMDEISKYDIDSKNDFRFIEFLMKKGMWKNEI